LVLGFIDLELQLIHPGKVRVVTEMFGAADGGGAEDLFAIGLDDEDDSAGVALKSGVSSRQTAQGLPLAGQVVHITGSIGVRFCHVDKWQRSKANCPNDKT
jgi:hypothetical protein